MVTGNLYLWSRRAWSWGFFELIGFKIQTGHAVSGVMWCGRESLADDIFFHCLLLVPLPSLNEQHQRVYAQHTCHAIGDGATSEERQTDGAICKHRHTFAFCTKANMEYGACLYEYLSDKADGGKHRRQWQNAQSVITSLCSKSFSVYACAFPKKKNGTMVKLTNFAYSRCDCF